MTLQERILEALGEHALEPASLYKAMSGDLASAVDFALRGLLKTCQVTFELGRYQRASTRGKMRAESTSPAAPAGPLAKPTPSSPAPVAAAPARQGEPATKRCRRCGERKPLTEFPSFQSRGCKACVKRIGRPSAKTRCCRRCGLEKPLEEFQESNLGTGKLRTCRSCMRVLSRRRDVADKSARTVTAAPVVPLASIEAAKADIPPSRKITFSAALRARLVERMRIKAEELQIACRHVAALREELADIEELVRMASEEGTP